MIDQFINFVIRPPRADYNPDQYLWEKDFTLAGRKYKRQDLELRNGRGHILRCSHYMPSPFPDNTSLPCVIYCHGNSGCRADANEAAVILLPSNITVFTLDFSGSGLSDGNYVSLGWHESDDLKVVVSYLRSNEQISRIGLWGRSMGAVTSLLYGAEDPSIAGMVLDSAFSNLFNLMMELVDVYKIRLPKFTVKVALQYMRRVIQKKAKFDIMDINALKVAPKTFIPALFGHAKGDKFIQPHHSDLISNSYAGDKNVIKFDGDHNSSRPQFYYDSVSIFFHNVLHPPQLSPSCSTKYEKYYDLGDLQVDAAGIEESLLYEIIGGKGQGLGMESGSASTSSAPPTILTTDSVEDYLHGTGIMPPLFKANDVNTEAAQPQLQESCSYTSSNRESWGRCSSLGSDVEPFPDCSTSSNDNHLVRLKVLATPLRTTSKHKNAAAAEAEEKKKVVKNTIPQIFRDFVSLPYESSVPPPISNLPLSPSISSVIAIAITITITGLASTTGRPGCHRSTKTLVGSPCRCLHQSTAVDFATVSASPSQSMVGLSPLPSIEEGEAHRKPSQSSLALWIARSATIVVQARLRSPTVSYNS